MKFVGSLVHLDPTPGAIKHNVSTNNAFTNQKKYWVMGHSSAKDAIIWTPP